MSMAPEPTAPRVSVIVPVYNVAAFLDQCLDSIRVQTMSDIEIICLNDGSTDESLAIMKRHAAADDRVQVIDKQNEGYGATCNRGIQAAKGDYIAIVEPDDYLLATMYEDMLSFADSFAAPIDVVKEAWFDVVGWDMPGEERLVPGYLFRRLPTSSHPQTIADVPALLEGHPSIWSALYRREFILERGIRFIEYRGAGWADNPFLIDSLCQARSIVYLDAMHYCYRNELSRPAGAVIDEERLAMPLNRWMEMARRLDGCAMSDPAVLRAHTQRGFNYIDDVMAAGGWNSDRIRGLIRTVLDDMDEELVIAHPKLSPEKKRFYLDQTGGKDRRLSPVPYYRHLAGELLIRLKSQGASGAFRAVRKRVKGTGQKPDAETME